MIRVTFSPPPLKKRISRNTQAMWEEHALRRGDPGVSDSQSYLPWVIRIETPSGLFLSFLFFSFFLSLIVEEKKKGRAREGGHRWPFGLSVRRLGRMSGRERGREGGGGGGGGGGEERWGRVEVKGKGVKGKTAATSSFPLQSAWWLQALDFHRGLTLLRIVLSLQSVWKLRPQREDS